MNCFVNIMYDETILVFYGDLENPAEKGLFESERESPYRNRFGVRRISLLKDLFSQCYQAEYA